MVLGAGGGGGWRGVNHTRVKRFWPCADTRTVTLTRIPGGALPSGNQNVCKPVASARAAFSRSPASKCATTVILAPGAVDTWTPTLVPVLGRLRVTDAVLVSGAGGGEVVGVGEGLESWRHWWTPESPPAQAAGAGRRGRQACGGVPSDDGLLAGALPARSPSQSSIIGRAGRTDGNVPKVVRLRCTPPARAPPSHDAGRFPPAGAGSRPAGCQTQHYEHDRGRP